MGYPTDSPKQKRNEIAKLVSELLLNKWSLPKPKLIMSIMGGTGSFTGSNRQQRRFKRAVITTAIKTGMIRFQFHSSMYIFRNLGIHICKRSLNYLLEG